MEDEYPALIDDFHLKLEGAIEDYRAEIVERTTHQEVDELEQIPIELLALLLLWWNDLVKALPPLIENLSNETLDQDETGLIPEGILTSAQLIGGYFVVNAVRQVFHKIHSANIARQISEGALTKAGLTDDGSDEAKEVKATAHAEAVDKAVATGIEEAKGVSVTEIGMTLMLMSKADHTARGIEKYIWTTQGDSRVRPSHKRRSGAVRRWDQSPRTGEEFNCRCYPIPYFEVQDKSLNQLNTGSFMTQKQTNLMKRVSSPSTQGITFKALGESGFPEVNIFGEIGDYWDGTDNTTDGFVTRFEQVAQGADEVHVVIDSGGGNMITGNAIYAYMKLHPVKVVTKVLGQASSAALTLSLAGDERHWLSSAVGLAHNAYTCSCRNLKEGEQELDQLRAANAVYTNIYTTETGMTADKVAELLDAETMLTAEMALELGFATHIVDVSSNQQTTETSVENNTRALQTTRENIKQSRACLMMAKPHSSTTEKTLMKNKGNQSNPPKGDTTDTPDVVQDAITASAELKAQSDILTAKNETLELKLKESKDELIALKASHSEAEKGIREAVIEDMKKTSQVRASATDAGYKAEGDSADAIMIEVLTAAGVKGAESLQGESLDNMFAFAIRQSVNDSTDDTFDTSSDNQSDDDENPYKDMEKLVCP